MLESVVCRREHFSSDWYQRWASILPLPHYGIDSSPLATRLHRKAWEWCAIAQALDERGMLARGRRGCGFAVGTEPLSALFASLGVHILATDQAVTQDASDWMTTNQHAASLDAIHRPELIDRPSFDGLVSFKPVDMRRLDAPWGDDAKFDFLWSSCSMEHLGSLEAGAAFVVEATRLLKPGGVAVHTTEFNVESDCDTAAVGGSCVYRERDIRDLDRTLRRIGCGLARIDAYAGDAVEDLDFDVPPFDDMGRSHIKLLIDGYISTSMLLIVRKGLHQ